MKKSLLALAAMGAFAGAAQAQSSVTVYGILDVGYIGGNERLSGPPAPAATGRVFNQNFSTLGASAQSTSRLGFRGTEDLGGGTRAFFTVEVEIVPNGAVSAIGNSTGNRAAFAGLGQKGVGQVSIGLQNTLVTDAISPTITGQFNNIVGSMIFPGGYDGGTRTPDYRTGDTTTNLNRVNGNNEGFTFRSTNTLKLQSDRFAGFQASAMWMQSGATSNQINNTNANAGYTGGKNDQNGWGLGLNYTWQKLLVTGAYQSFQAVDPYTAGAADIANGGINLTTANGQPAPFSTAGSGRNVTDSQAYVGATYDFGILKAYAGWINRKVTSQINSNAYLKRTAQEIGVRADLTKTIEGWASVGNGRFQTFGNGEPTANLFGYQLGANYNLSKRSNLYAIYGQSGTSNSTTAAGSTTSYRSSQYAVGVRHTF